MTLSIMTLGAYTECDYAECHYVITQQNRLCDNQHNHTQYKHQVSLC
jgi:hypothetical protein